MKNIKLYLLTACLLGSITACKDQLDIQNPNQPTVASSGTEAGIVSLATGGVYANGFKDLKYYDGVSGYFWTGAVGFLEIMGDNIGAESANQYLNQIGPPDYVILDNGTKVLNPNSPKAQVDLLRLANQNANGANNPLFFEWAYMYALNNVCNSVLDLVDGVAFTGDAAAKKSTIKAWAYWWKGFAYSRIGSLYYAGIINNTTGATNGNYVTKEAMITEANANFDKAATELGGLSASADYSTVLGKLIPGFNQVGKGGVLTPEMWKRNINTYKARNLLVNTKRSSMTAAQWQQVLTLTNDGITATDLIFTGRSNDNGDFISPSSGTIGGRAVGANAGYKISERLVQEYKTGDKRFANNIEVRPTTWIGNSDRGNSFNTRYDLIDGGKGMAGVVIYGSQTAGVEELYLAGTYEENELMKAEAKIFTGDIEGGLKLIDAVRTYQGAGLTAVAGTGLALAAATEELRRERRVALALREGISFYDARRWGVLDDVAKGGGRTNAVLVDNTGKVNTKATINYNFLDYWDVPDNEITYNPPVEGSAVTKNPR